MSEKFMRDPIRINVKKEQITLEGIKQYVEFWRATAQVCCDAVRIRTDMLLLCAAGFMFVWREENGSSALYATSTASFPSINRCTFQKPCRR